jgi:peroxiredoxin
MSKKDKLCRCGAAVTILTIMLIAAVILAGCKKHPDQPAHSENSSEELRSESAAENIGESAKTETNVPAGPRPVKNEQSQAAPILSLNDVIRAAKTWQPVYTSLYRRPAPDFVLIDITGNIHKLSDYRGKDVLLIFWATWCGPCRMEVPGLIELRRTIGEDKLAMLAVTSDKLDVAKRFIADQEINYTVLLDKGNMPEPYGVMRIYSRTGVPCSFFISPDGKIKLATSGLLSLSEMKAILQAEL